MSRDLNDMVILTTPEAETFARNVYSSLSGISGRGYNIPFSKVKVDRFPNKEIYPQIPINVRKRDVFLIHSFVNGDDYEPNENLMELYLIDDALRMASVNEITYILPHMPYQRQDRKDKPRVPISARRVMKMIYDPDSPIRTRMVTFDMHAGQIQGFVSYPVDNLEALPLFVKHFKKMGYDVENTAVISADLGASKIVEKGAEKLGTDLAIIEKYRHGPGKTEVKNVIGVVRMLSIFLEDLIDTSGTLCTGTVALRERGAEEVYACATHAVLSPSKGTTAEEKIRQAGIKLITTDTIPRSDAYLEDNKDWLTVLSVAPMTADAIYRIQTGSSISELFE